VGRDYNSKVGESMQNISIYLDPLYIFGAMCFGAMEEWKETSGRNTSRGVDRRRSLQNNYETE
jgi:hypothetical protein